MAAVGEIFELKVFCRLSTQLSVNVLHYRVDTNVGLGATDPEIAAQFATLVPALWKNVMVNVAEYYGLSVQKILPAPPRIAATSRVGTGFGAVAGDALPKQTAGLIKKGTVFAGRSKRGRCYLPFPCETDSGVTGEPAAAYTGAAGTIATFIRGLIVATGAGGSNDLQPILLHRATGSHDLVTTAEVRGFWATQRRRGSFGRPNDVPF